ncbi:DUF3127 domain-containing protein [Barnesiella sp. WM24]|uniref:DUF3127 domain-containing protein n=1 Tax=Barnesiella sp. WM24 TaxID=2558278 RepID=UPI0010727803|nr:DUF3127 domain-containing protein [Barnesiella sp. WM24]MDE6113980.1 DUF3127 domain-containing protein [Muribaculum sp.]TFU92655.1 DUF3127 domain-containing protein [Barnesiella sp. WM24]
MEIEGRIILALPEQSGTSKAGNEWKKREYVLETHESYPRKVHFDLFGQKADQYPLNVGDEIRLSFDINSREYNGRWFTSISGWKVEPAGQPQGVPSAAPQDFPGAAPFPPAPAAPDLSADPSDDLPF